ncbi:MULTISPECIES: RNA polymerase sigma factor [Paenibacillus]|uniref:RNA polymerase sigma factor n=1 Tax=Paenibacillus TaxID=44249 RepID=UPI0022B89A37|nr:RNA polymerase sigma factor [Paenibacillus caseinilyticus]MCZ8519227.1 RNA polymerase sigma factor [Paenibacillus caseinilyticus]
MRTVSDSKEEQTAEREEQASVSSASAEEENGALLDRARHGDAEAFGELMHRHRTQAYRLASSLARDAHLAEDIVQEAMLRAFLRLGTLADPSRFVPWLQRIVRNEAYMKLRRGGPYAKEQPLASMCGGDSGAGASAEEAGLLDRLHAQSGKHADPEQPYVLPEASLLRRETLDTVMGLLGCLTPKERCILEAAVLEELSPSQLSTRFGSSTAAIYKVLSRSRQKLREARLDQRISQYTEARRDRGCPPRRSLDAGKLIF